MKSVAEQNNSHVYPNRLTLKMIVGACFILLSYIIGWPGVAFFAWLSLRFKDPLWLAAGGSVIYSISHLVFLLGAYMVGERYVKSFWRWITYIVLRRISRDQQETNTTLNDKKE